MFSFRQALLPFVSIGSLCFSTQVLAGSTYIEIPAFRATYGFVNIEDKSRTGEDKTYKLNSNGVQTLPSRLTFVARGDQFELQLSRFLESPTGYLGLGYALSDSLLVFGLGLNGTYGTVSSLTSENRTYKQNLRSFSVGPYARKFFRFDSGEIEIRGEANYIRDFSQSDEPTKQNPNSNLIYTRQASGYEADLDMKYWASVYKGVHLGSGVNLYYKSLVDKYGPEYSLEGSIRSDLVFGLSILNARVYF